MNTMPCVTITVSSLKRVEPSLTSAISQAHCKRSAHETESLDLSHSLESRLPPAARVGIMTKVHNLVREMSRIEF